MALMDEYKSLTHLKAEEIVLNALRTKGPQKIRPLVLGLYCKFTPEYYSSLEGDIIDAFWRLQEMGIVKMNLNREMELTPAWKEYYGNSPIETQ